MNELNQREQQRRRVLLTAVAVTAMGALYFAWLNVQRGLFVIAFIELAWFLLCASAIPMVRRTHRLRAWTVFIALLSISAMVMISAMPGTTHSIFVWVVVLPPLLYFLLGTWLGLPLSLLALAGAAASALYRLGLPSGPDQWVYVSNFSVGALVSLVLAHVYERGRAHSERDLRNLAATDSLTGLPNRNLLYADFDRLSALAVRRGRPLAALLLDLDHFKRINDRFGHAAGDQVLVSFGQFLKAALRSSDQVYRIGGEEFLVLLPETAKAEAAMVAEKLRAGTAALSLSQAGERIQFTVSIGVAQLGQDGDNLTQVLRSADQRLYRCKAEGRNCVRIE